MSKWLVILTETFEANSHPNIWLIFQSDCLLKKKTFCFPFPLPSHFFRFLERSPQQREIIQTLEKLESE